MTANAEQEVCQEFERRFEGAAAKDIDGVMSHMADNIVSYERIRKRWTRKRELD
jgi:hypothetical protein